MLIGLAWMAAIIALFYGEENWRARHAWNKYRRELEARGEQLDFRAFIPKPVPDDQDFAATPFVQSSFPRGGAGYEGDSYSQAEPRISGPEKDRGNRHFRDLTAWSTAFAAVRSGDFERRPNKRRPSFQEAQFDLESRAKAAPAVLAELKRTATGSGAIRQSRSGFHPGFRAVFSWVLLIIVIVRKLSTPPGLSQLFDYFWSERAAMHAHLLNPT